MMKEASVELKAAKEKAGTITRDALASAEDKLKNQKNQLKKRYTLAPGKNKQAYDFAHLIVKALNDARESNAYPDTIVEMALLAFLWKKIEDKEQWRDVFSGMPDVVDPINESA